MEANGPTSPTKAITGTAVHSFTRVLPGGRVEVASPALADGQAVDVFIVPVPPAGDTGRSPDDRIGFSVEAARERARLPLLEFLDALPAGPRSAPTWDEVEGRLDRLREGWDR